MFSCVASVLLLPTVLVNSRFSVCSAPNPAISPNSALTQRPEGERFGVAAVDRHFVFREHRQIAPILPGRRQLNVVLDLRRVIGDVLAVRRLEFGAELDKPVGQRTKASIRWYTSGCWSCRYSACRR